MNTSRLALMLVGVSLIFVAGAVLYFQTDLRNQVPAGAAIAFFLLMAGLFVIGFSEELRRGRRARRLESVEHVEHVNEYTPVVERSEPMNRPPRRRSGDRVKHVEHFEEYRRN